MEAKSANVSIPGVEGCLLVRAPSAGDVLLAPMCIPTAAGFMVDEVGGTFCACDTALWGEADGGRVVWAKGEG